MLYFDESSRTYKDFAIRNVDGHYAAFDTFGKLVVTGDTYGEVVKEIEEMENGHES